MAQGGLIGNGVRVAYATGSPHTWKKLEQVLDCVIPTIVADKIDSTIHGTARFKRNFAGMQEVGDLEIMMLRDPDSTTSPNQNSLFDYLASQTQLWWRVEVPAESDLATTDFEAYEFQGRVASFEPTAPITDRQELKCAVTFDGSSFVRYQPYASVIG